MARVVIGPASQDRKALDVEIAHLRGLDVEAFRARWHTQFRRKASPHLPRHLLFRIVAYRLQADHLGDLDPNTRRVLERARSTTGVAQLTADLNQIRPGLVPGTVLTREWDGRLQHVMVLTDGFSWKGKTYKSLSKVAFAITNTKWSGPRFFGMRDRPSTGTQP